MSQKSFPILMKFMFENINFHKKRSYVTFHSSIVSANHGVEGAVLNLGKHTDVTPECSLPHFMVENCHNPNSTPT